MGEKITAEQLFNTIVAINKQISNMENCYKALKDVYPEDIVAHTLKVLGDEINRLREQLDIFKSTDVGVIKNTVYSKQFDGEICKTLYGEA